MSEGLEEHIKSERRDFQNEALEEASMQENPMAQFKLWLAEAIDNKVQEPYAMCISTIGQDGFPSSRMVFMREMDADGLIFYTNYKSRKGQELEQNSKAVVNFHWELMDRQVNMKGEVHKVSNEQSDAYFNSRPRESQIGAWASDQSQVLGDRTELEARIKALSERFEGKEVSRPEHWGGYVIRAKEWEFWQGRSSRLHDRIRYRKDEKGNWQKERLNP
jgi:pyridoxamine 5'-phosphate oxidase